MNIWEWAVGNEYSGMSIREWVFGNEYSGMSIREWIFGNEYSGVSIRKLVLENGYSGINIWELYRRWEFESDYLKIAIEYEYLGKNIREWVFEIPKMTFQV